MIRERLFKQCFWAVANPELADDALDMAWRTYHDDPDETTFADRLEQRFRRKNRGGILVSLAIQMLIPILVDIFLAWIKESKEPPKETK